MSAPSQAGAVAEVRAGAFGTKYLAVADPGVLQVGAKFYAAPPAAVPVEALEGLVAKWRKGADEIAAFAETQGPTYQVEADSGINWLRNVADELTQLIKERTT